MPATNASDFVDCWPGTYLTPRKVDPLKRPEGRVPVTLGRLQGHGHLQASGFDPSLLLKSLLLQRVTWKRVWRIGRLR